VTKQYFEIVGSLLEFSADPKLETWVNTSIHMHVRTPGSWRFVHKVLKEVHTIG